MVQSPHALNPMSTPFFSSTQYGIKLPKVLQDRYDNDEAAPRTKCVDTPIIGPLSGFGNTLRKPWDRYTFDLRVVHLVLDTMSSFLVSLKGFGFIKLGEELFAGLR